jgi:hypothetical protein
MANKGHAIHQKALRNCMIAFSHYRDQDFNSHQKYHFCLLLNLHDPCFPSNFR